MTEIVKESGNVHLAIAVSSKGHTGPEAEGCPARCLAIAFSALWTNSLQFAHETVHQSPGQVTVKSNDIRQTS